MFFRSQGIALRFLRQKELQQSWESSVSHEPSSGCTFPAHAQSDVLLPIYVAVANGFAFASCYPAVNCVPFLPSCVARAHILHRSAQFDNFLRHSDWPAARGISFLMPQISSECCGTLPPRQEELRSVQSSPVDCVSVGSKSNILLGGLQPLVASLSALTFVLQFHNGHEFFSCGLRKCPSCFRGAQAAHFLQYFWSEMMRTTLVIMDHHMEFGSA